VKNADVLVCRFEKTENCHVTVKFVASDETNYKLDRHMTMFRLFKGTHEDISIFYSKEYVDFLSSVTRSTLKTLKEQFKINTDCPAFKGFFPFSQAIGGSIGAAVSLNR
jgi:acetoin utilization deacetylase AcuC-like enzyme